MRLVILVYHLSTFNKKKEGLCGCTTAVFVLRRKKLGCQKTLQNFRKICLFSLQNFAFWMQNLRLFFAKNRGDSLVGNGSSLGMLDDIAVSKVTEPSRK